MKVVRGHRGNQGSPGRAERVTFYTYGPSRNAANNVLVPLLGAETYTAGFVNDGNGLFVVPEAGRYQVDITLDVSTVYVGPSYAGNTLTLHYNTSDTRVIVAGLVSDAANVYVEHYANTFFIDVPVAATSIFFTLAPVAAQTPVVVSGSFGAYKVADLILP